MKLFKSKIEREEKKLSRMIEEPVENIYQQIIKDHQEVQQLFEKVLKGDAGAFPMLKKELLIHMKAEEEKFYPVLAANLESHELALLSTEEHHVARKLLEEIEELEPRKEKWRTKLKILQNMIYNHIHDEEYTLIPLARRTLEEGMEEQLSFEFMAAKTAMA